MEYGVVMNIINPPGYGFIRSKNNGLQYFFHRSVLVGVTLDELKKGTHVRFTIADNSPRGPRAGRVERAAKIEAV